MPTISHGLLPGSSFPKSTYACCRRGFAPNKPLRAIVWLIEHHLRLPGGIILVEAATGDQIGAHGRQEITADDAGVGLLCRWPRRPWIWR